MRVLLDEQKGLKLEEKFGERHYLFILFFNFSACDIMEHRRRQTMQINIHESDPRVSQLVERVVAGEEIIISSEAGEPIAKLVPYPKKQKSW